MHNLVMSAWRVYQGEPLATRVHVVGRVLTCPFGPLIEQFPLSGTVLDVGCGHGLLINFLARDPSRSALRLYGIDHDAGKIERAHRTGLGKADFSTRTLPSLTDGNFDVLSIVDVLYTIKREDWDDFLAHCYRLLRPGGRLIVKEVVDRPRWKYWMIMAQETLSVRLIGITKGERPHIESPAVHRAAMTTAGFRVIEDQPLASTNWISHHLFVGHKA